MRKAKVALEVEAREAAKETDAEGRKQPGAPGNTGQSRLEW